MTVKILYVEDDTEEIMLMNYFFKKYVTDAELFIFNDGNALFEFLNYKNGYQERSLMEGRFCILLDINLPYLNGFEILEKVKNSDNEVIRNIPVVMFSTSDEQSDKERSFSLGAVSYMEKPKSYNEMKKVLENLFTCVIYSPTNQPIQL